MKQLELFAPASEHPEDVGPGYGFFKAVCIEGAELSLREGQHYWIKDVEPVSNTSLCSVREWSAVLERWCSVGWDSDDTWYRRRFKEV